MGYFMGFIVRVLNLRDLSLFQRTISEQCRAWQERKKSA